MSKNITLKIGELSKAPQTVGVYQFIGKEGVLYIGKAVNIKARLASHQQTAKRDPKEKAFFGRAKEVKITPAESEFQALLLEAKLIRKEKPKYNRRWKDDKSPLYIEITEEDYPKIHLVRKADIKDHLKTSAGRFFGPFQSKPVVQKLLREIRKVIPFCTRKRITKKPCFHSKIGLCHPCPNPISSLEKRQEKQALKREYRTNIRQVKRVLKGKTEPVLKELRLKIRKLADQKRYEEALALRNRLFRFERLISQTLGIREDYLPQGTEEALESLKQFLSQYFPNLKSLRRIEAFDISSLAKHQATAAMVVLTAGAVDKSQYRKFKVKNPSLVGDTLIMREILKRRFGNRWPKPNLIVVDGGKPQVRTTQQILKELKVAIPAIGIAKAPDRLVVGIEGFPTERLPLTHPGFNLIRLIRDESHRFSRKYHLLLRGKEFLS